MKRLLVALLMCLGCTGAVQAQDAKPDLLLYIHPDEYRHEVRLGVLPYYIVWAHKGQPLERAARQAFEGRFGKIGMCEGTNGADMVVWLQPVLTYSPPMEIYHAKVVARFFRADGRQIGQLEATGTYPSEIGSNLVETHVQNAFDAAMQSIVDQYAASTAIANAMDTSLPKSPCALVALVPRL